MVITMDSIRVLEPNVQGETHDERDGNILSESKMRLVIRHNLWYPHMTPFNMH